MKNNKFKLSDRWIFDSFKVTAEGLGLFRIFASLLLLFFLMPGQGLEHFQYLSRLPHDFLSPPPGPMMLLDEFPPFIVFLGIYTILLLSLIAMLIGYKTRWVSVLTGFSILALQGLLFSVGKINHEIILSLVPLLMAFSNWGACFSVDEMLDRNGKKDVYSWPLTLLALFIAFMMFTAGFPKILGGWLDPATQAVKGHVLNQYFVKDRDALLAPFVLQIDSPITWEILDWVTIIFEIGFLIALWRATWFKIFLIVAVFFHFSTQLLMNISFLPNFLAYSAFLNWDRIYRRILTVYKSMAGVHVHHLNKRAVSGFFCGLIVLFSILKWLSVKDIFLPDTDLMLHEAVLVFIAVLVVIYISFTHLFRQKRNFSEL